MKKVIDCFTFYNELEILELRLEELYDSVDVFILVEAEKTHKGENKRFIFEENKWRFEKWLDKIVNVKVYYPSHIEDAWGREKFQRNSFMPTLYTLGLKDKDIVFITDVDEILNSERVNYIKNSYDLQCINKMEMTTYFGDFRNKEITNKWYHPKVVNWGTLKNKTPDECRLTFDCQWWENGGWHLTYFGGAERIANKLENFAHQEYNKEEYKNIDHIERSISEGRDLFGEWRKFERIEPEKNPCLPNNWRILEKGIPPLKIETKKNLVIGAAIGLSGNDVINFVKSFRSFNQDDDVYLITNIAPKSDLISILNQYNVKMLSSSFNTIYNMNFNLNIHRFYKFLDFVTENKKKYEKILITDVTDVVFQANPFDMETRKEFIIFSQEYEGEPIKNNSFNSRWISITFGDEVLNKIGEYPIICAGTTIGSYKNILNYLKSMVMLMTEKVESNPSIVSEGIDQGVHNFIVRTKDLMFKNHEIRPCGDFIATVGITSQRDKDSIVIKDDYVEVNGMKPSIIHQYNRSKELINFYDGKYKNRD
jgi:beta-1,4-mannosyl-glycoprotein beta-1,4-N-acetylglucosaminyltransferase